MSLQVIAYEVPRIRKFNVRRLWFPDTSQGEENLPGSPSTPLFIQYAGRAYAFRRDLYFPAADTSQSAPTVAPPTGARRSLPLWMRRLELEKVR